ncbi:MAG: hypothetical protein ACD_62C00398G0002 [uncultured bacterium]|nr:MAG: hypothetical protein ACD_62C00398G0002 [uncultured bacterium]
MILFGALFAVFSHRLRQGTVFADPYLWHAVVFATVFNVAVVWAIRLYPDWMWMYFLKDSHNTPSEYVYLFVFLYYFPVIFGFYLGRDLRRVSFLFWLFFMAGLIAVEAWLILKLFDRYAVLGTNEAYLSGKAISLFGPENPLSLVMNGAVGVMIVYFLVVAFFYRRSEKKKLAGR